MPRRVLYVEDNPGDFELLSEAFLEVGCTADLERVPDGLAAVRLIDNYPSNVPLPALIIIDLNLPKVDGERVLTHAKAHDRLKDVPMVILTSSTSPLDRHRCQAADGYLAKGARWDDCLALARQLCRASGSQ